jgi:hypothetical protein
MMNAKTFLAFFGKNYLMTSVQMAVAISTPSPILYHKRTCENKKETLCSL